MSDVPIRDADDMTERPCCELCGDPMPPGEEMFKYHGYSGPCPKQPKQVTRPKSSWELRCEQAERERDEARADAAQLRQDVEALAAADVELRRKIADLRHIANVNGDWTVKVSELVAALNTASALLVEAQAERDGAMDTITTRTWERDEARALLLDIDQWFRQDGASFPDYIQGRLDAALGGRDA